MILRIFLIFTIFFITVGNEATGGNMDTIPDRNRIIKTFKKQPENTQRNQRYLALLNKKNPNLLEKIDTQWFNKDTIDKVSYKSREQTAYLEILSFMVKVKGSTYFEDPQAKKLIKEAFNGIIKHIDKDGRFTWEEKFTSYGYESHEHAWRLLSILLSFIWVGDEIFSTPEKMEIEGALLRAAQWLYKNPLTQTNNRGISWLSVMVFCGHYFEKPEWLAFAEKFTRDIICGVIYEDGEVGEHTRQYSGGGPCSNYTYTSWPYLYLWRICSDSNEFDERLFKGLCWNVRFNTITGWPIVTGASVRIFTTNPKIEAVFPMLERFAHKEKFFAYILEKWLERLEKNEKDLWTFPVILAMIEKQVQRYPENISFPNWYKNSIEFYKRPTVHYALVSKEYQTGITFKGCKGYYEGKLRGLQTFAYRTESPILLHTKGYGSSIEADGINTSLTDADDEIFLQASPDNPLDIIITRYSHFWVVYAFTPFSVVVITFGAKEKIVSRWVMNKTGLKEIIPEIDSKRKKIFFKNLQSTISFTSSNHRLEKTEEGYIFILEEEPPLSITSFSTKGFALKKIDIDQKTIVFSDDSGSYEIDLNKILVK